MCLLQTALAYQPELDLSYLPALSCSAGQLFGALLGKFYHVTAFVPKVQL